MMKANLSQTISSYKRCRNPAVVGEKHVETNLTLCNASPASQHLVLNDKLQRAIHSGFYIILES